jgi:hypothetical protein
MLLSISVDYQYFPKEAETGDENVIICKLRVSSPYRIRKYIVWCPIISTLFGLLTFFRPKDISRFHAPFHLLLSVSIPFTGKTDILQKDLTEEAKIANTRLLLDESFACSVWQFLTESSFS